jgi:RNA polymerase sigma factor (sigma-70 family)
MNPEDSENQPWANGQFMTTRWSLVRRAGATGAETADIALRDLYQAYWYPLYSFIRRQGRSPHDAEDLTQGFFVRLLEKNFVAEARQDRGKFRSFLLTALKNFLANEWDRQHAQKRGGFQTSVEIDQAMAETRLSAELRTDLSPEGMFDRQWALLLLERTMCQLRNEYVESGRAKLFEHLGACLTMDASAGSYAKIAADLGLTEASIKQASYRLRARYREILRAEIGMTVVSPEKIDDELRFLFTCFGS